MKLLKTTKNNKSINNLFHNNYPIKYLLFLKRMALNKLCLRRLENEQFKQYFNNKKFYSF